MVLALPVVETKTEIAAVLTPKSKTIKRFLAVTIQRRSEQTRGAQSFVTYDRLSIVGHASMPQEDRQPMEALDLGPRRL